MAVEVCISTGRLCTAGRFSENSDRKRKSTGHCQFVAHLELLVWIIYLVFGIVIVIVIVTVIVSKNKQSHLFMIDQ